MKLPKLALPLFAVLSVLACCPAVKAEPGYFTVPKKLQKVEYYHAPLNVQIVDERMRVKNFVEPDAPEESVNIAIPAYAGSLPSGSKGVKYVGNHLQRSGFSSQIPAGGFGPAKALQPLKMGMPANNVRPIGLNQTNTPAPLLLANQAKKSVSAKPVTAVYAPTAHPSSSNFSFKQEVKADVRANLRGSKQN